MQDNLKARAERIIILKIHIIYRLIILNVNCHIRPMLLMLTYLNLYDRNRIKIEVILFLLTGTKI